MSKNNIIANFTGDFSEGDNNRFLYLAKELYKKNDSVELITSDFFHTKKEKRDKSPVEWPFKISFLHEPGYPKNICLKRFYSHFVWGRNVKKYLESREKPDAIYAAVPSLTAAYEAAKYCEKNGIKFIVDVQDLWPEAFQMVFNVPVLSSLIFAPFKWLANGIYKRADETVAVSQTYADRALSVNKKCKKAHVVFLGTELSAFDKNVKENPYPKENPNELWLGYCGTLGASYDLKCVIDALKILKDEGIEPPKFMVFGDGPRKQEFECYAKEKGVNACFTGRLEYSKMCSAISACDIVVNPIKKGSAGSIINKHADYAACGKPVVNTQECAEYRQLVEEYNCGFNCNNGDAKDLAEKIKILIQNEDLRKQQGSNARKLAEEKFDRENSYKEIIDLLN